MAAWKSACVLDDQMKAVIVSLYRGEGSKDYHKNNRRINFFIKVGKVLVGL